MQMDLFTPVVPRVDLSDRKIRENLIKDLQIRKEYRREIFYTPAEVASLLRVSYFRVFWLCKWYTLVSVKINNLTRIPVQEVIEYLEDYDRIDTLRRDFYAWLRSRESRVAN